MLYRVGQSREIWTAPRHRTGRLPSYPTAALAASARRVIFPKHLGARARVPSLFQTMIRAAEPVEPYSDEPTARNTFDTLPRIITTAINQNEAILA